MRSIPTKAEILAYRQRTGATVTQLVEHFYAGCDEATTARAFQRVKKMVQRERQPQTARNAPAGDDGPGPEAKPIVVEDRHAEPGKLARVAWLERQLGRLEAAMDAALGAGNVGRVTQVNGQMLDVRSQLDQARSEAGRLVELDRNPGSVAAEVKKRSKALEILENAKRQGEARKAKNL